MPDKKFTEKICYIMPPQANPFHLFYVLRKKEMRYLSQENYITPYQTRILP